MHLHSGRVDLILELIISGAVHVEPSEVVADCRDAKDNMYLELALAAGAVLIISSDDDLLSLSPWRVIPIVTPAQYVFQTWESVR